MSALKFPLVVDLDGTLTPTDTLWESVVRLIQQSLFNVFPLIASMLKGRTGFKSFVASEMLFDAASIPYRGELIAYLQQEKQAGRTIVLATAAHHTTAMAVADHIKVFDKVIASDENRNLKGEKKLNEIRAQVGDEFVYAGDSNADLPIWRGSNAAILVNTSKLLTKRVNAATAIETEFMDAKPDLGTWIRALRVHQWLKNLLIFVPLLTAFSFQSAQVLATAVAAFLSFSMAASATYVFNDLWDLDSDRAHPRKRSRPLASAQISIIAAVAAALALLITAFVLASVISGNYMLMLAAYLAVTSSYSWVLKTYVLVDVIVLSLLFTLRILAGSVAIEVTVSTWLLAFSVFVFLSLALVKRCSELVSIAAGPDSAAFGRDYRVADLAVLWPLGASSAMAAVVIFGLFINAPETVTGYASPYVLWLAAIALIYWLSRLWLKTARGEMHDDPIIYTMKDRASLFVIGVMVAVVVTARYVDFSAWVR